VHLKVFLAVSTPIPHFLDNSSAVTFAMRLEVAVAAIR